MGNRALKLSLPVTCLGIASATVVVGPAVAANAQTVVRCTVTADNPHYSSGAHGVIFKTRVTCDGDSPVTFVGHLSDGPQVGPLIPAASHSENRYVSKGVQNTFYVPQSGAQGLPCNPNLYYQGYAQLTGSTTTSVTSYRVSGVQAGCP